jgi:hypothetical protein
LTVDRRKKEEGRRKKEEGRRKKEELTVDRRNEVKRKKERMKEEGMKKFG